MATQCALCISYVNVYDPRDDLKAGALQDVSKNLFKMKQKYIQIEGAETTTKPVLIIFVRNNHIINIKVVLKHHMFGSPCTVRLTILSWCTIIRPAPGTTHHSLDQHLRLSIIRLRSSLIPCSCWRSLNRKQQNQLFDLKASAKMTTLVLLSLSDCKTIYRQFDLF